MSNQFQSVLYVVCCYFNVLSIGLFIHSVCCPVTVKLTCYSVTILCYVWPVPATHRFLRTTKSASFQNFRTEFIVYLITCVSCIYLWFNLYMNNIWKASLHLSFSFGSISSVTNVKHVSAARPSVLKCVEESVLFCWSCLGFLSNRFVENVLENVLIVLTCHIPKHMHTIKYSTIHSFLSHWVWLFLLSHTLSEFL